jgi:hypothetical protein
MSGTVRFVVAAACAVLLVAGAGTAPSPSSAVQEDRPCEFEVPLPADSHVTDLVAFHGRLIVAGSTFNPDFPTTADAADRTCGGQRPCHIDADDGFVMILSAAGEVIYSTFVGADGEDHRVLVAPAREGGVWVLLSRTWTLQSRERAAVLCNGTQPVLFRLVPGEPDVMDLTCVGGPRAQASAAGLALSPDGALWVAGHGSGIDTTNAWQPLPGGPDDDLFVARYEGRPPRLALATYLGGSGNEEAAGMALAPDGDPVIVGSTQSTDFPVVRPVQPTLGSEAGTWWYPSDAVVVRLDATGRWLEYSTWLGGRRWDYANGVSVDALGNVFVVGSTSSEDFPATNGPPGLNPGAEGSDAFLAVFDDRGRLRESVMLRGTGYEGASHVVVRPGGDLLVLGSGGSPGFQVMGPDGPTGRAWLAWIDAWGAGARKETIASGDLALLDIGPATTDALHLYLAGRVGGWVPWSGGWVWREGHRIRKLHLPGPACEAARLVETPAQPTEETLPTGTGTSARRSPRR